MSKRPSGNQAASSPAMRGALLIAAAVLLGAGLLANGFRDEHSILSNNGSTPTTKKSTTTTVPTGSTVVQPHDPAQVKVLVLNGSGKAGVAKSGADLLKAANYTTLEPTNAKGGTVATSVVYFVPGYDADAATVTAKLGLPASAAQPLPTPPPAEIADPKDANVVVVVGSDAPIAGGAGAGTTSSTTPTTAAAGATTTTVAAN